MMETDVLIDRLSHDVQAVPRRAVERRMAAALLAGAVIVVALIPLTLGFRDDLGAAMMGSPFWMKMAYTLTLALAGIAATIRLARPDAPPLRWLWLLAIPVLLLAVLAAREWQGAPASARTALVTGISWDRCALNILFLSLPLFGACIWAFRRFAPTRLRMAGAMAGLAAGGMAATLYGLHCPEASATFVLVWYSLGMAIVTLIGGLTGPRLLRW